MAFAVFADIHGNLEALEAIIKDARKKRRIKDLYFLGDAITFGPDSSACLKLLKKHNVKCIVGNHEQRIVRYDKAVKTLTYATTEHMNTIFNQLDREDLAFIKTMPVSIKMNYKGVNVFLTHYAHDKDGVVRDDYQEFTEAQLHKLFGEYKSNIVIFAHVHKRKIIIDENVNGYVCVGSSGCVHGDQTFYTLFDVVNDNGGYDFDIYKVRVNFNRKKFVEKLTASFLPDKQNYAMPTFGVDLSQDKEAKQT
jgi:predicted phosphodiesterase